MPLTQETRGFKVRWTTGGQYTPGPRPWSAWTWLRSTAAPPASPARLAAMSTAALPTTRGGSAPAPNPTSPNIALYAIAFGFACFVALNLVDEDMGSDGLAISSPRDIPRESTEQYQLQQAQQQQRQRGRAWRILLATSSNAL